MRLAVHQPAYWPWRGFLEKWRQADLLVVLDTVSFTRGNWQNRCKLRTPHGDRWLTVPVIHKAGQLLKDVQIAGDHWRRVHEKTLAWAGLLTERAQRVYAQPWERLVDLDIATMEALVADRPWCLASKLDVTETDPTERLVALCQRVGATTYLHGRGALSYMRPEPFTEAGIALELVSGDWPPYTALAA